MSLAIIDVVFLLIILALAINGAIKGFIAELLGKAAFLVGLLVGILFYDVLAITLIQWIPVVFFAQILSFLLLFVITFIIIKLIQHLLSGIFKGDILGSLNKALGFFLGIGEGFLIVAFVLFILHAQPWMETDSLLQGSFFNRIFMEPVNQSVEFISQGIDA